MRFIEKVDLTEFSDRELSLQVYNTEALYNVRKEEWFIRFIKYHFDFTQMQLEILIEDLTQEDN